MNNKIFVVIIALFILLNAVSVYAGAVVIVNPAIKVSDTVFADSHLKNVLNTSSFKQIPKYMYDMCVQVCVDIQDDVICFLSDVPTPLSINCEHRAIIFADKSLEYSLGERSSSYFLSGKAYYPYGFNFSGENGGFHAVFVFFMSVFMLFLNALYKGSVPNGILSYSISRKRGVFD